MINKFIPRAPQTKPRKKSLHPESKQQISCVTWFRYQYPQFKRLLFAIPNGGRRTKTEAAILVEEGVVAGVPDLCLAVARHGYHGFYIEMKYGRNSTSDEQKKVIADLREQNYKVEVCYTFEEFINLINNYLNNGSID